MSRRGDADPWIHTNPCIQHQYPLSPKYSARAGFACEGNEPAPSYGVVFTAQLESQELSDIEVAARARVGLVVGDTWRLEAVVGIGGTGAVYRASNRSGLVVAIKVMHALHLADRKTTERFTREAMYANRVNHPSVLRVFDEGQLVDGCPYLVTELLTGQTLEDERLEAGGALPLEDVISVGFAVLEVLMKAHRAGMVHRDLKPQNIFRTRAGEIKVLDFGLGRFVGIARDSLPFTVACVAMGTVGFMAPEQALGKADAVDPTTDLWALGATLLMLATGLDAHEADTPMGALSLAATKPVAPTASRTALLMKEFCAFLDRAMSFQQARRFQSAIEMRIALEKIHDRLDAHMTRIDSKPPVSIPPPPMMMAAAASLEETQMRKRPRPLAALGDQTLSDVAMFASPAPWAQLGRLLGQLKWENFPKTRLSIGALVIGAIGVGMLLSDILHGR
jgi:serine/threonine protein kinase